MDEYLRPKTGRSIGRFVEQWPLSLSNGNERQTFMVSERAVHEVVQSMFQMNAK